MKQTVVAPVFWEDGTPISARMTIIKKSEQEGTLKNDGRKVWYDGEKKHWYIPERVAKGEARL
jgi:hypothetical protein